eukprot:1154605-Pelagomonas_calceolata.AAC.5
MGHPASVWVLLGVCGVGGGAGVDVGGGGLVAMRGKGLSVGQEAQLGQQASCEASSSSIFAGQDVPHLRTQTQPYICVTMITSKVSAKPCWCMEPPHPLFPCIPHPWMCAPTAHRVLNLFPTTIFILTKRLAVRRFDWFDWQGRLLL